MNKLGRLRISAAIGYLAPARVRPNLDILADTLVRRLLFTQTRCTGVEVEDQAGSVRAIAARLVVVCAGALLTPSLLLRSGIGPKALLEKLRVPCVADRPGVGQNL